MSIITKYVHFPSIVLILSIGGIIDSSSLPLASAAPGISLSPSSGDVGSTVNVHGSGFSVLSSIEILFNDVPVSTEPKNITTGISGQFDAKFDVPQSAAGSVVVTAREKLLTDSATSEFTVLNEAPVAEDLDASTDEDTALEIALTATDANGDALAYAIVQDPEHGTLTGLDEESGTVTYTPDENYNGNDEFEFKVNDGLEDSNTAKVSITIVPVNDPPMTESQELSVEENGEVDITLVGSDPDGDDLTFSITDGPVSGTLTGDPPNLVYRPPPDFYGSDSFEFVANDGTVDSNVSTVDLIITSVNSAPSVEDISVETDEDESVTVTLTADDSDSDQITFTIMSQPSHGTLGQVTQVDSASAMVTYSPAADYNGADSFTFRASDGDESSNTARVEIDIKPVNDVPTVNSQNVRATAGQSIEITLTGTDPDGDDLSFQIVEDAERGTLGQITRASDTSATVSYRPDRDQSGSDSFTFRASDGDESSNTATVSISISAQSNTGSSSSGSSGGSGSTGSSQGGSGSAGAASDGAGSDSGSSDVGADGTNNDLDSNTNTTPQNRVETERSIGDEVPIQDNDGGLTVQGDSNRVSAQENEGAPAQDSIPGQTTMQSLAANTVEGSPFLSGPAAWLLPGAIIGVVSVVAFLGYRERQLKKGNTALKEETAGPAEPLGVMKENASRDQAKLSKLQDRITFMVSMSRIHRIFDDEKGKTAREKILDVEYNKGQVGRTEYENSKSIVKSQLEQIGSILRSNPLLKESFLESFGNLTIKVWWAIKQDVHLDGRRGRRWESLEWLGSEVEKYWSTRSRTSSRAS